MVHSATSANSTSRATSAIAPTPARRCIDIFRDELPIRKRLERIFAVALDIYLSGDAGPRGCFTVMTAASEAVSDPEIRAMVLEGFSELDKAFAACFRLAKEKGELPAVGRSRGAGATGVRHRPHHRDPRPRPRAAQASWRRS